MNGVDFDSDSLYVTVESHDAIINLFAVYAVTRLIVEGVDVSSAYSYENINDTVYMEQHTNSTGRLERIGFVCKFWNSIYSLRQAGKMWGSLFVENFL